MMKRKTGYSILVLLLLWSCEDTITAQQATATLADPTILYHQNIFYLYGTGANSSTGFFVYTSKDLVNWSGPEGKNGGYALKKGDAFGDKGFWAPQVFEHNGKFYMAYTANEQIAIAVSDSPLGPFRRQQKDSLSGPGKQIDPYIFRDDDGSLYMYHVRLTSGNRIYVAKLKPDLSDVDTATAREALHAEPGWENTRNAEWPVAEGPTVIKHKGKYYLIYSANDFRNPDYAVGYAVSDHPMGPWIKQKQSPVISRSNIGIYGTGHGDILILPNGEMKYAMHTHHDSATVAPRLTGIVDIRFEKGDEFEKLVVEPASFRYLTIPRSVSAN
ncbi:MAG: glycoside hydrolase family 43 protein [Agriterribacter sp.]